MTTSSLNNEYTHVYFIQTSTNNANKVTLNNNNNIHYSLGLFKKSTQISIHCIQYQLQQGKLLD